MRSHRGLQTGGVWKDVEHILGIMDWRGALRYFFAGRTVDENIKGRQQLAANPAGHGVRPPGGRDGLGALGTAGMPGDGQVFDTRD